MVSFTRFVARNDLTNFNLAERQAIRALEPIPNSKKSLHVVETVCGLIRMTFTRFLIDLLFSSNPVAGPRCRQINQQSVALVYEHGEGRVTKAVAVDKGLEFTIGEMTNVGAGQLSNNRLFRGGEVIKCHTLKSKLRREYVGRVLHETATPLWSGFVKLLRPSRIVLPFH